MCLAYKGNNQSHDSSMGEGTKEDAEINTFKGNGSIYYHKKRLDLNCVHCSRDGHETKTCKIPWEKVKEKHDQKKQTKDKAHN